MRDHIRRRHALVGELSQRDDRKVPTCYAHAASGPETDAAHARRRSASGTTEGKESRHSVSKIIASHCRPLGKTRTNDLISQSARLFHVPAVQQLRRGAQLPELQCRSHLSSTFRSGWIGFSEGYVRSIKLSFVRAHRCCAEKVSGLRTRRVDLSGL